MLFTVKLVFHHIVCWDFCGFLLFIFVNIRTINCIFILDYQTWKYPSKYQLRYAFLSVWCKFAFNCPFNLIFVNCFPHCFQQEILRQLKTIKFTPISPKKWHIVLVETLERCRGLARLDSMNRSNLLPFHFI